MVRERPTRDGVRKDYAPYATYTPLTRDRYPHDRFRTRSHEEPELAGVKVWPVKELKFPDLSPEVKKNRKVQTRLRALPPGTVFEGVRLRFHNLRGVELGALLWALTFGRDAALRGEFTGLRHRLGMGKPYGLGQISIRLKSASLRANDLETQPAAPVEALRQALSAFLDHMRRVYPSAAGTWDDSVQVKSLVRAADPEAQGDQRLLQYMELGDRNDPDSFVGARFEGCFLAPYVEGGEVRREGEGDRGARPGREPVGGGSPSTGARTAAPPAAGPPRVGARVRMKRLDTEGEIVEEHANEPRWGVRLDGQTKAQRYRENLFTVIS